MMILVSKAGLLYGVDPTRLPHSSLEKKSESDGEESGRSHAPDGSSREKCKEEDGIPLLCWKSTNARQEDDSPRILFVVQACDRSMSGEKGPFR